MKKMVLLLMMVLMVSVILFAKSEKDSLNDLVDSVEFEGHKKTITVTETTTTVTEVIVTTNYIESEEEIEEEFDVETDNINEEVDEVDENDKEFINIDIEINPGWLHKKFTEKVKIEEGKEEDVIEFKKDKNDIQINTDSPDEYDGGGFGGPVVQFTKIAEQDAILSGGQGAWVVNKYLFIGGAGYGLVSHIPSLEGNQQLELDMGYGGPMIGIRLFPSWGINITAYCLAGFGTVGYRDQFIQEEVNDGHKIFVLEPGVDLNIKLAKWMAISGGVRYREVHYMGDSIPDYTPEQLTEYSFVASVKFGWF